MRALSVLLIFVASAVASQLISCNTHELGHVFVAVPLGWEVETIHWCTPAGGGVEYSHVGTWAGNIQGYAGGLAGAIVLAIMYVQLFARKRRPFRSPEWWFAGLGTIVWVGPQILVALLEGSAGPNDDYAQAFEDGNAWGIAVVTSVVFVAAMHWWRWRRVFHRAS